MPNYVSDQIKAGQIHGWHVYVLEEEGGEFCKIGSAFTIPYRLGSLQGGNPRRLSVFRSWHLDDRESARGVEYEALKALSDCRLPKSEWVKFSPAAAAAVVEAVISDMGFAVRADDTPRWDRA